MEETLPISEGLLTEKEVANQVLYHSQDIIFEMCSQKTLSTLGLLRVSYISDITV